MAAFRHVTLPQLVPAIVFFAIVETITMLSWVFAYVYVMTTGGPGNSTVVTEFYIYQKTFLNNNIGIGAAAAVSLLALVARSSCAALGARRFDDRRRCEPRRRRRSRRPLARARGPGASRSTSCCCLRRCVALLPDLLHGRQRFKTTTST